jgi:hypothetical protein
MPEITRRTFVEGKDLVAEEQDFKSREIALDVRGWTSYCVFLTDRDADKLQAEVRKALPRATLQAVASQHPAGVWLRGAHWELEAAIKVLKI